LIEEIDFSFRLERAYSGDGGVGLFAPGGGGSMGDARRRQACLPLYRKERGGCVDRCCEVCLRCDAAQWGGYVLGCGSCLWGACLLNEQNRMRMGARGVGLFASIPVRGGKACLHLNP
jgi:hypothetical protein